MRYITACDASYFVRPDIAAAVRTELPGAERLTLGEMQAARD